VEDIIYIEEEKKPTMEQLNFINEKIKETKLRIKHLNDNTQIKN
jgi:hypothetical protein